MIALVWAGAAVLGLFIAGGLDDEHRRRAEARAELARAHAAGHAVPMPIAHHDAHLRAHAASRALLPHIPHQRGGGDR